MTTHKTWSAEEKLQIVLESLHPRANVSEIPSRFRPRPGLRDKVRAKQVGKRSRVYPIGLLLALRDGSDLQGIRQDGIDPEGA